MFYGLSLEKLFLFIMFNSQQWQTDLFKNTLIIYKNIFKFFYKMNAWYYVFPLPLFKKGYDIGNK